MTNFSALLSNRLFKAFGQMSLAGVLVQLLALVLSPVLSRIYTPAEFGIFGYFMSIVSLLPVFAAFRLEFAFFIQKRDVEYFLVTAIAIAFFVSLLSSGLISCFGDKDLGYIYIFLGIFVTSVYQVYSQLSIACAEYKKQSVSRVFQGSIQYALALLFGWFCLDRGLVVAYICGVVGAISYLFFKFRVSFSSFKFSKVGEILRENRNFCLSSTFSSALQWIVPLAPMFIGKKIYGAEVLGVYFFISQLILAPTAIVRRSLLNIVTSEMNKVEVFNRKFIPFVQRYYRKFIGIGGILILILGVTYFWGEDVIVFIWGEQWASGGKFLHYIAIYAVFDIMLQPFSHLLNLWGHYRCAYIIQSVQFLMVYVLAIMAGVLQMDFPEYIGLHYSVIVLFYMVTMRVIYSFAKKSVKGIC